MLYNVYLISSVLAGEGMVLSGRGGEGSVEKNGGGTWSVTNDNSYIYTFLNLFNYKRKNKIRKKIQSYKRDTTYVTIVVLITVILCDNSYNY